MLLDGYDIGAELPCITANHQCCTLDPHLSEQAQLGQAPSGVGSWRYPNGSYVRLALAGDSYGITRQQGRVNLHRQRSLTTEGLWRCEVPMTGTDYNEIIHVGLYSQDRGI